MFWKGRLSCRASGLYGVTRVDGHQAVIQILQENSIVVEPVPADATSL